jgi:hypothetical protein
VTSPLILAAFAAVPRELWAGERLNFWDALRPGVEMAPYEGRPGRPRGPQRRDRALVAADPLAAALWAARQSPEPPTWAQLAQRHGLRNARVAQSRVDQWRRCRAALGMEL